MSTSAVVTESTRERNLSGLCEICLKEAAEFECVACGPVRMNKADDGPLSLCAQCSASLHDRRLFNCHKLVNISRKLWLPVEEKLELLTQKEAMISDRKTQLLDERKEINNNYEVAIEQLQVEMNELGKVIDDKQQLLSNNLTDIRDQQLLSCDHIGVTCTALLDHVTKMTSKAKECLVLEAHQFAELNATLLHEMSTVLEQSIPPSLSISDFTFSLADSVARMKQQVNDLLVLPTLRKQIRAGEHIQGTVVSKLHNQGLFWLRIVRRDIEGALMVISQSIRADLKRDLIKPVTKATVGQIYCAYFSEDKEWHRASVVATLSTSHVRICFVDYGNYDECPVSNLRSLPDKYLLYPFQTIRCCLTNEDGVEFSREARWLFNDRTKNKIVHLYIISELPGSSFDDNEIHYLVTVKEPGEGGADISSLVLSKMREEQKQPKHPIIHRDYRITQQQRLAAATPSPAVAPPVRPPSRLNTDAAEFVLDKQPSLQRPGVLQVSQPVFHKMVGVSVTNNVVKMDSEVKENFTTMLKDSVKVTPNGKGGCVTSTPTTETVTTIPTDIVGNANDVTVTVDNVTTTPADMGNNVTTAPTEIGDNIITTLMVRKDIATTDENVTNTHPVTEDNVSTTDNVITTSSGVGNTVMGDRQDSINIAPIEVAVDVISAVKDDVISTTTEDDNVTTTRVGDNLTTTGVGDIVTTTGMVGDKVNDNEKNDTIESVGTQQSDCLPTDNEALPCSDDNCCHGNCDCPNSKDEGNLEHVSTADITTLSPSTDVSSKVDVIGSYEIDNVAPPPNESLVSGATIEISIVSDLQSDGRFWSQLVADEETDEIFCDLMESLQSICAELYSSQHSSQGIPLVGSFCAALFSADNIWYRALVEQVTGDKLLVRYMDYGNAEIVSHDNIVPLVPKMKELPFQAFLSTISSEERNNFTPLMCERFSNLVKTNDVFQAKVISVRGEVVEVELTVQLNDEVINVNDDVYLTDFVTTESLHFSQATVAADPKLTWTEQMEALDSPVTPTKDLTQLTTSNPQQPLPRERSKSTGKSKSHKSSPVCSVRKISNSSSRRMLKRQWSNEKPSGNKKPQQKKTTVAVDSEDTGVVPSCENWETEEESLVGGADGGKDDAQMLFIKGLPPTISVEAVRELFNKYGNVKDVKFDNSYPGRTWITMDVKGARNAASQLRNHVITGGDPRGLLINETEGFHPKSRYRGQGVFKRY